jgi:hypothetical protein
MTVITVCFSVIPAKAGIHRSSRFVPPTMSDVSAHYE